MNLGDRLAGRALPTQVVALPVDRDEHDRLSRDLAATMWALEQARSRGSVDTARLRADVARLEAALDAADTVEVRLRALPPAEWEALVDEHAPDADGLARGDQWAVATFRPALLAVSVVLEDGDEPPDWDQMAKAGALTAGELTGLFDAAVMLNVRGLAVAVGKGR